ncbi:MAG: L,D-transpeptidase family protein [Bacillota bacterium]
MKKIICLLVIAVFLFSGCQSLFGKQQSGTRLSEEESSIITPEVLEVPTEQHESARVEEYSDIEDIQEDIKLTEEAKQESINEEKQQNGLVQENAQEAEHTNKNNIINTFSDKIPDGIFEDIQYDKYVVHKNYVLVLSKSLNIRKEPTAESEVIGKAKHYEKLKLHNEVKGQYISRYDSDSWYEISWLEENESKHGYVFSKLVELREFQFEKMKAEIIKLKEAVNNGTTAYISNYKNRNGAAPLRNGKTTDDFGIRRYQSAPAYYEPSMDSDFRYIADGALINTLEEIDGFYKITTSNFAGEYYVPSKYISFKNSIEKLEKVIVVDRKNQNEAVFEINDDKLRLISYIYATTGEKAKYKLPTDLGYYMAIEKRERFLYLDDVTKEVSGYAPYAIRFSGGTYIHGVPVEYQKEEEKLTDPGLIEYLVTIGTTPRSHKCVRNYTSHAKYLYDWAEIGKTAVIVIE